MSPLNFPSARARKALYCVILSVVCLVCVPGLAQSQTDQPVLKITPVAPAIIYPIELSKERRLSAFTVFCEDFEHITAESAKNDIGLFLDQTKVLGMVLYNPIQTSDFDGNRADGRPKFGIENHRSRVVQECFVQDRSGRGEAGQCHGRSRRS
jgi:hypothetical protein